MQKQRQQPTRNQTLRSIGRTGLLGALAFTLAGCVAYVEESPHPTYVAPPPQHPVPPPAYMPPPTVQYQAPPPAAPPPQVVVSVSAPAAEFEVAIRSESDFYEPLAAQGDWVVTAAYGRCWRPARVEAGWRPYCNGHWQWTEAGWYWVSDEPWAWATYHYGRWDFTAQFGWVWVPQTEWAPAWVSWRAGAGYVGWAPMPPPPRVAVGVHQAPPAPRYVFVEERRLVDPVRPTTVIVNNTTVINQTVNITKVNGAGNNRAAIHEGPPREAVERASGRRIQPVAFHELRRQEEAPVVERQRNSHARAEKNGPPAHAEPAPQPGANPHPAPRPEQPEPPRNTPPPASSHGHPEVNAPQPAAKPERSEPAGPVRVEKHPEPVPVTVQPQVQPQVQPTAPPREVRPAQKPVDVIKQPAPAGNLKAPEAVEQKPAAKPVRAEPEQPARIEKKPDAKLEAVQPPAVNKPAPLPGGKQTEQQLKPGKERAAEKDKERAEKEKERAEKDARKKAEKKKGAEPEAAEPPAAIPPAR